MLSCRVCGRKYPLDKFLQDMDDAFEEALGNTRCDRL
ncbi:MAG: dual CXXC motif small (seleno)protein [Deltaproteobacteria bacterium]|nr:dual CXXC motif small (seleno)protein [Deltaproteobacteria bacterium]